MYLHHIRAQNFRAFGDGTNAPALDWKLNAGLNILIGENDAGKTAIIDAIRLLLWTTSFELVRLLDHDFNVQGVSRANVLTIEATLRDLTPEQEAAVLEWLTYEADGTRSLVLNLQARRHAAHAGRRARIEAITRAGKNGTGPEIGSAVRELVRATYLRPLRDAEAELRPGRQSRLSQILGAHALMENQGQSDFDPLNPTVPAQTLVGMMDQAQHQIGSHVAIGAVQSDINDNYLSRMSFADDGLAAQIRIAGDASLTQILERFELGLLPPAEIDSSQRCPRGLGYNNALFMATELVLLRSSADELGLLLVEEPEAHLHPQLQERVLELIQQQPSANQRPLQVVMTTHSPSLAASAAIESMTLVHKSKTYPLRPDETKLARMDYEYLRRFIDATKSNLFFARGIVVVEGPAEALLLPAIAEMAGLSFSKYGVSVVNVGDVGLYHYARIFQRAAATEAMPLPVACITDRDIVPDIATYVNKPAKGKRFESDYSTSEASAAVNRKIDRVEAADDPNVKVFVSDRWTLEYDLAMTELAPLMFLAISVGKAEKSKGERLTEEDEAQVLQYATEAWPSFKEKHATAQHLAVEIYQPLYEKAASKAAVAQYAAKLLRTGKYGVGQALLDALPPYIKSALRHLTRTSDPVAIPVAVEETTV